jgi:DNA primase
MMQDKQVHLPDDYTLDVPKKAMLWYLKYGIDPELAASYGIGYSPSYERVILPVLDDGELIAVQMRAVEPWHKPKYLNPTGPKVAAAVFMSAEPTGITVVVEDILSAIKVGKVAHATSILGTSMTDQRANRIARLNHTAIVWMDNDRAGREGRLSASRQLRLLGMRVFEVRTDSDPKTYSIEEIKKHLRSMKHVN